MLMKLSSWDEFNGKDFVYVCSATGQSIVNLIPIFHLGKSRVKAIIILVGDENHSHASEQASTKPAKWLADFALAYLKLDESKIKLLPGNSETFVGQWPKLLETAQEFGLTLVANLTGGTKPMALAIDRTLMAIKEPYLAATVDKSPALCRLSALLNNTEADHLITKIVEPVPLEVLVLSKEYELAERSGKKEELAFYNNHSDLARSIWQNAINNIGNTRAAIRIIGFSTKDKQLRWTQTISADIERAYGKQPDLSSDILMGINATKFLNGGWLEQYIYDQTKSVFAEDKSFIIEQSKEFKPFGKNNIVREIDTLILDRDTPHFIEVKAQASEKCYGDQDKVQTWIDKAATIKETFGGMPTRSWIIAPFLDIDSTMIDDYKQRASKAKVTLLFGVSAVETLLRELQEIKSQRVII